LASEAFPQPNGFFNLKNHAKSGIYPEPLVCNVDFLVWMGFEEFLILFRLP